MTVVLNKVALGLLGEKHAINQSVLESVDTFAVKLMINSSKCCLSYVVPDKRKARRNPLLRAIYGLFSYLPAFG